MLKLGLRSLRHYGNTNTSGCIACSNIFHCVLTAENFGVWARDTASSGEIDTAGRVIHLLTGDAVVTLASV